MIKHKAVRPCACVRAARVKTAVLAGSNPAGTCDLPPGDVHEKFICVPAQRCSRVDTDLDLHCLGNLVRPSHLTSAAKRRGVKLGGDRGGRLSAKDRRLGIEARQARAAMKAVISPLSSKSYRRPG
jgi:hypothetical protein